ncbi:MAG: RnfABCDGE type electron transport complex subunit G [Nitrospirae bacterium]|nr:RnfABCDGE type electron transport complex subunit G [Nitrospirota bacterium]
MNDMLKITVNLTVICALAGVILAFVWAETDPVRVAEEARERELALKELMPSADMITPIKDVVIADKENVVYEATAGGKTIGYVVSSAGKGYSSYIKLLVAVNPDYKVTGIEVLGHAETPGLGDRIQEDWFKSQFTGKGVDNLVVVKQETDTDIQAISGATISSRAVTLGVKDAVVKLREVREGAAPPAPAAAK